MTPLLWAWIALAPITFLVLLKVVAPYGRHARAGFGPSIGHKLGWFLMEAWSPIVLAIVFLRRGPAPSCSAPWILFALWQLHYLNRAFIYPFRQAGPRRPMPVLIVASGATFNLINAYFNADWLARVPYPADWLADPRFLVGVALFFVGMIINITSDEHLLMLRRANQGYQKPTALLFRYFTSPNYVGEMIEWSGFALAAWSPPALAFAVWVFANLVPRARAHRRWYEKNFIRETSSSG
jgi:hypothetical protein